MEDPMNAIKDKLARGYILKVLKMTHPTPTPLEAVSQAIIQDGLSVNPDIKEHIDYLLDRKYITIKTVAPRLACVSVTVAKLTADGVDVLQHTKQDPGVIIPGGDA